MWKTLARYRPGVSFLAIGLLVAAAVQAYQFGFWTIILAVLQFWICGLTMVWNDLADRKQDTKKGRAMSDDEYRSLKQSAIRQWWWLVGLALVYGTAYHSSVSVWQTAILLSQIGVGVWIYNRVRPYYLLNNLTVAITGASPCLLVVPVAGPHTPLILGMFMMTGIVLMIREVLKDIQDAKADKGYKGTLPLRIGSEWAHWRIGRWALIAMLPVWIGLYLTGRWEESWLMAPPAVMFGWGMIRPDPMLLTLRRHYFRETAEDESRQANGLLDVWLVFAIVCWWFHPTPWMNHPMFVTVVFLLVATLVSVWGFVPFWAAKRRYLRSLRSRL
ncbi:MAG: UbiA family prenyltransferase [bacterium]